ncbi:MAG: hydantoinase/oxoprolinase family protein, partial [Xanthobacteraceae bacterium]
TVTDADLLLGYVPADYFLGGEIPLDAKLAEAAVEKLGDRLGLNLGEATQAIFTTVNSYMADQITAVSTNNGYDVRDFTLVVGGGAGPVHGAFIAELLGIRSVIIPTVAALYSAYGMFAKDVGRDFSRPYFTPADGIDPDRVNKLYREMEEQARQALQSMVGSDSTLAFSRTAEMRYIGQFHDLEVPLANGIVTGRELRELVEAFHARHEELFTFRMAWKPVELITLHLKATIQRAPFSLRASARSGGTAKAVKRERLCVFAGETVKTPVYDGEKLGDGDLLQGPAIIEEPTTSVVIPEGFRCAVDAFRNFLLTRTS